MKITDVRTTFIELPRKGIMDATILKAGTRRSICFVHILTDEGIEGLGWAAGNRGIQAVIETTLKDVLLDKDPLFIEKRWWEMFWTVRGVGRKGIAFCAISAVDIALWDLRAKYHKVPLYQLLGPYTDSVPIYGSGGWTDFTEEELIREQMGYVEQGIPRVKMKVGKDFGQAEREDVHRLAAVRKALGDDVEIYIDANNGYYAKQAIYMAREFAQYNVGWFEEPVLADDIDGLAAVAAAIDIPVATGEHEYTKYGFKDLITRGGADIVQPDVGRVGGITEWMKVAHLAQAFNLPVAPHAVQTVHLHLACATPNLKVVEYLRVVEDDDKLLFVDFPQQKNGMWSPFKDRPGLGLELNPDTVKKYVV
ncbi:MAG: mandelate racemase/muconate lactonizing enzyme family protein [Bacteroidetes bacterium]|nr:mandelate racemase/muconate lactonizing enzyme family protein [Bacteroidota bacterium]MCL5026258.1 mandelate racemase/muconate lactonizing enzyme family protein [Chloroflexota bacterium]